MAELKYKTSKALEFSDDGSLVYFTVNVKELFNVSLSYPGMRTAVRTAFIKSKKYIPVKTGLMKKSYTMKPLTKNTVMFMFDPQKILGKRRGKYTVKNYYPQYLNDTDARRGWLDLIMKQFYSVLIALVKQIEAKRKKKELLKGISTATAVGFLSAFMTTYNKKLKEEKARKKKIAKEKKNELEKIRKQRSDK